MAGSARCVDGGGLTHSNPKYPSEPADVNGIRWE